MEIGENLLGTARGQELLGRSLKLRAAGRHEGCRHYWLANVQPGKPGRPVYRCRAIY